MWLVPIDVSPEKYFLILKIKIKICLLLTFLKIFNITLIKLEKI